MKKLIGVLKLGIALILGSGMIVGLVFTTTDDPQIEWEVIAIVYTAFLFIGGFLQYYLLQTAIWDFKDSRYKRNFALFLGMLLYLLGVVYFIYMTFCTFPRSFLLSSLFGAICALMILVRDLFIIAKNREN